MLEVDIQDLIILFRDPQEPPVELTNPSDTEIDIPPSFD